MALLLEVLDSLAVSGTEAGVQTHAVADASDEISTAPDARL